MTEGVAMQSLSLYGCVDFTLVARLLQGRMERRNYVDIIRCRRNEKRINFMWKIRMVSVHTSILLYHPGRLRMLGGLANLKTLQKLLKLLCGSALEVKNLYAS